MNIGIAGAGRMGAAIAQRLLSLGHKVSVWNRTRAKAEALAAEGAVVVATPDQLAQDSEIIITILTDAAAIEQTYSGPEGLLTGDVRGKTFIEMSTVRPDVERALAKAVQSKGAALVECPVGGTVGPARDGKLLGLVGGADEDVARLRPLLESLCRRVEHLGPIGAGAAGKLAINLPLMVFWQSFGEALALVQPLGIDAARLVELFADTSGGPNVLKVRGKAIAEEIAGGYKGPVTFDVESMCKDLRSMIAEGNSLGVDMPACELALASFSAAAKEGLGDRDCAVLPVRWARKARQSPAQ
jgi:3-hydroxyisobutyrate dehydrogenase